MKVLIFSDSHVCGPPLSWEAIFDKRVVGLFNHHYLRKHHHNQAYLTRAVEYIIENPPDMVICTGDITTSSEPSEFALTIEKLNPIINDKRFEFFFIPGNHDVYVNNKDCLRAMRDSVKHLNKGKIEFDDLPVVHEHSGVEFCFVNDCLPVNLIMSCGKMSKETSDFVMDWLDNGSSKPKVLVGHYPLDEGNPVSRWRHRLYGQGEVLRALRNGKLDLSLCGHVHWPTPMIDERGRGEIIIGSVTRNHCIVELEYIDDSDLFKYKRIDLELDK